MKLTMKKLMTTFAIAGVVLSAAVNAQTVDPKLEWATKAVALQQGPELERLVGQLADSATQDILQNWGPRLQSDVPPAKIEQAKEGVADKCRALEEEKERFQKVAIAALNILNGGI